MGESQVASSRECRRPRRLSDLARPIPTSRHCCSASPAGHSGSWRMGSAAATKRKRDRLADVDARAVF